MYPLEKRYRYYARDVLAKCISGNEGLGYVMKIIALYQRLQHGFG